MIVAQLTYDHLDKRKGNLEFTDKAFDRFWGISFQINENMPPDYDELEALPKTKFKLYDDDGILYFDGWLKNDDDCMVQQFVLAWAMSDSGCTSIKVKIDDEWKEQIS